MLTDYLESQRPEGGEEDDEGRYLFKLTLSWAQASQNNNHNLFALISGVFALLLTIASSTIELRDHGFRLGRTLLHPAQLKLLAKGTTASRTRARVIASTLDLLSVLVAFDGGSLAKRVYDAREFTFQGLSRNLGLAGIPAAEAVDEKEKKQKKKKVPVRSNALHFLFVNFRHQPTGNKRDLLAHRDIVSAVFRDIRDDPAETIVDILTLLKAHVILDEALQQYTKRRLLNEWTLGRLAPLYRFEAPAKTVSPDQPAVDLHAHQFLVLVCTTPGLGVLHARTGWYPPGSEESRTEYDDDVDGTNTIDLRLDVGQVDVGPAEDLSLRNSTLSTFIQTLRPYASILQSELLREIFRAAPELVADYFSRKRNFSMDPKLTTTWMGYCAFVFSVIQIAPPAFCGYQGGYAPQAPPLRITIENILPQPLSQKVLTRCLTQKSKLISFVTLRLLVVAFDKLDSVLRLFRAASAQGLPAWRDASANLIREFCGRCPKMSHVITVFRNTPEADSLRRETVTRLLESYYRVLPQVALDEKFDVSTSLTTALGRIENLDHVLDDGEMRLLELEHLLQIARYSPDMRWWSKPGMVGQSASQASADARCDQTVCGCRLSRLC